jgi:hypothetical protein
MGSRWSLQTSLSIIIRSITLAVIGFSIGITYYVYVIQKDYEIITLPDGPDTSDYFE